MLLVWSIMFNYYLSLVIFSSKKRNALSFKEIKFCYVYFGFFVCFLFSLTLLINRLQFISQNIMDNDGWEKRDLEKLGLAKFV